MKNWAFWLAGLVFAYYICNPFAGIAQLVEHDLAKVGVAGPSPVSRSKMKGRPEGCPFSFEADLSNLIKFVALAGSVELRY